MKIIILLLVQLFVALSVNSYSQQENLSGESLFLEKRCVRCHTMGRGRFVGPDLYKISDKYKRDEIIKWAKNPQLIYQQEGKVPVNEGYPPMPPANLSQQDAEKVADYLIGFKLKPELRDMGLIRGKVTNETSGKNAEDVEIVLRSYLGDVQQSEKFEKVNEDSEFSFGGLDWNRSYELTVLYDKAQYTSSKMVFAPNQDTIDLELPVFESTDSDESIIINNLHVIIYPAPDKKLVNITFIYEFFNSGRTIYVGTTSQINEDQRKTLVFNIPKEAKDLNFLSGLDPQNVVSEGEKYFDTSAINPGIKNVVYSYNYPLNKYSTTVEINPSYRINNLIILAKKENLDVEIEGIQNSTEVVIENEAFKKYERSDLSNSESLLLVFEGVFILADLKKYIPVMLFLLFVTAGIAYSRLKNSENLGDTDNNFGREKLLKEIARLDDLKDLDGIEESEYLDKRNSLMNRLINNETE